MAIVVLLDGLKVDSKVFNFYRYVLTKINIEIDSGMTTKQTFVSVLKH